ncbi:winged helix DNA-binding domain-containing protein [Kineosporia rhizophila]|uniref:winged helix DNA-binding domain-containing protein n=1 Tax=Kineosporia rhizophila TaxID=84633 RepID=UPI001E4B929D|nr:winged helix DNA-binding domain-containing protein [Kineosporia rhizophila]MCE0538785.1 winged helix DNA-binding domain-containing protein [Kineosporia rhizophila]
MSSPISTRSLGRATLARQHLLEPARMSALEMIEHLVGLQSQEPLSAYGGLWTRLVDFRPSELSDLIESRQVVRILAMRGTVHLLSAADCLGLRPLMQPVLDRIYRQTRVRRAIGDLDGLTRRAQDLLRAGPIAATDLSRALLAHYPDADLEVVGMATRGSLALVQVPPRALWGRSGRTTYVPAADWLGKPLQAADIRDVIRRYLAAYGPATVADVQAWCKLTKLREITDTMPGLLRLKGENGADLLDLPDAPRPAQDVIAPVRMLPDFDNVLLSHADRSRFMSPDDQRRLSTRIVVVPSIFLVDGTVGGWWHLDRKRHLVTVTPFRRFSARQRQQVLEEAVRAGNLYLEHTRLDVREADLST